MKECQIVREINFVDSVIDSGPQCNVAIVVWIEFKKLNVSKVYLIRLLVTPLELRQY